MDRMREDSVLFSLRALEELQRERLEREEFERATRERAAELALREEERLHREAEARRARAEIARKQAEEAREREEGVRVQAMREAILERARVESEWKGRLELEAQERRHQERMGELRARGVQRRAGVGFLLAAVTTAAGVGSTLLLERRLAATTHLVDQQSENLSMERESRQHASELLRRSEARVEELTAALVEAESAPQVQEPVPSEPPVRGLGVPRTAAPSSPESSKPAPRPCKDDGDPLSDCLPSVKARAR